MTSDIYVHLLFAPAGFHVAGPPDDMHTAMSYQTAFQLSVPIAFTFHSGRKVGGSWLDMQARRSVNSSVWQHFLLLIQRVRCYL